MSGRKGKAPEPQWAQGLLEINRNLGASSGSGGRGSSGGGLLRGLRDGGGFAAALGLRRNSRSFADQFRSHDAGDEELCAVIVEINRCAFLIGRSDNSESIHLMLDGLTFLHYLHRILLETRWFEILSGELSGAVRGAKQLLETFVAKKLTRGW